MKNSKHNPIPISTQFRLEIKSQKPPLLTLLAAKTTTENTYHYYTPYKHISNQNIDILT